MTPSNRTKAREVASEILSDRGIYIRKNSINVRLLAQEFLALHRELESTKAELEKMRHENNGLCESVNVLNESNIKKQHAALEAKEIFEGIIRVINEESSLAASYHDSWIAKEKINKELCKAWLARHADGDLK